MRKDENTVKVSYEDVRRVIENNTAAVVIPWMDKRITVINTIPMRDVTDFIESVFDFGIDRNTNTAYPEFIDLGIRANVVMRYSNVELPADLEEQYKILYCTNLYDVICKRINQQQLAAIKDTVAVCLKR